MHIVRLSEVLGLRTPPPTDQQVEDQLGPSRTSFSWNWGDDTTARRHFATPTDSWSVPSRRSRPLVGWRRPESSPARVDFPLSEAPSRTSRSPLWMRSEQPDSAGAARPS